MRGLKDAAPRPSFMRDGTPQMRPLRCTRLHVRPIVNAAASDDFKVAVFSSAKYVQQFLDEPMSNHFKTGFLEVSRRLSLD